MSGVARVRPLTQAILAAAVGLSLTASTGSSATTDTVQMAAAKPKCNGARATKVGSRKSERITGTRRRDVIIGGGGNDTIRGLGGNDVVCAGSGNDTIEGGSGTDTLSGQMGSDTIQAGSGNDVATGGSGRDRVLGGDGNDRVGGGRGTDTVDGQGGVDSAYGGLGADTLTSGSDGDSIFGGPGADRITGSAGADTIDADPASGEADRGDPSLGSGQEIFVPDASAEHLLGPDADASNTVGSGGWNDDVNPGGGADVVSAGPGADTVAASDGDDRIDGGSGSDKLAGGDGGDQIAGASGDDDMSGDGGDDDLQGGDSNDQISGGGGNDRLDGGDQRDRINGDAGADTVLGGNGGDTLTGGQEESSDGPDDVNGGEGVDDLYGGAGGDTLTAGGGADVVFGGGGDDVLDGGSDYDTTYGQLGSDRCANGEQVFLCEQRSGAQEFVVPRDAPADAGVCDAWASTYLGDDGNPGSAGAPFRTVERMVNALRAGETGCLESGGTFEEADFEVHVRGGGDPGNPITLRSAPGGPRATIKGRIWVDERAHDVVFTDLNLDGRNPLASLRGVGASLPSPTVNGDRITFYGNDVSTSDTATCFAIGSVVGFGIADDTVIRGNRIHDCGAPTPSGQASGDHGVDIEGSRRAVVSGNYIFNNGDIGVLMYTDAQGGQVTDNVIHANRRAIHYGGEVAPAGWIYPVGTKVYPENNPATNNVITYSTLAVDGGTWQVSGYKGWGFDTPPNPGGNDVDRNCFYHPNSFSNIQHIGDGPNKGDNVGFTEGPANLSGPDNFDPEHMRVTPLQPPLGPGYVDSNAGDFRLRGGTGECPRTYGPEDPPDVSTGGARQVTSTSATLDWSASDRTRGSGSSITVQIAREAPALYSNESAPQVLAPASSRSGSATFEDLEPGTTYRYRVVGAAPSGLVAGEIKTFTTSGVGGQAAALPDPRVGVTANLNPLSTGARVKLRGVDAFYPLKNAAQISTGSEINTKRGKVDLLTVARNVRDTGAAEVSKGLFKLVQGKSRGAPVELRLSERLTCPRGRKASASASRRNRAYAYWRRRGYRRFSIIGRYAGGSARGTKFYVEDRCDGTMVRVEEGTVTVRDFVRRRNITVKTGRSYFARARR